MDNKEVKLIESLLENANGEAIRPILEKVRESGAPELIPAMVSAYKKCNKEVQQTIFEVLCDLRQPAAADIMVNIIELEADLNVKQMLVTSCWYSNVDYSGCLRTFIDIVIQSPFELAFEAFTVIENNEGRVSQQNKEELVSYISKNQSKAFRGNETLVDSLQLIIESYDE
jgi:hypothetical protein